MTPRTSLALSLVLGVLLVGGCAGEAEPTGSADPEPSTSPTGSPSGSPDGEAGGDGSGDPATCELVRAGIDAFNAGDYEETAVQFTDAVPRAEAAVADDDSRASRDLLDAVRYYAELPPEDYPAASLGSPDFLRYKQITLLQCAVGGSGEESDPPGVLT